MMVAQVLCKEFTNLTEHVGAELSLERLAGEIDQDERHQLSLALGDEAQLLEHKFYYQACQL